MLAVAAGLETPLAGMAVLVAVVKALFTQARFMQHLELTDLVVEVVVDRVHRVAGTTAEMAGMVWSS
tara:strand:- start:436 stop:636 length:201 start_codon:yes stop_codon:yes gene_type:complete